MLERLGLQALHGCLKSKFLIVCQCMQFAVCLVARAAYTAETSLSLEGGGGSSSLVIVSLAT